MVKFKRKQLIEAVKVRNIDFNGVAFDGNPFSDFPSWLSKALEDRKIKICVDNRDYASWEVLCHDREVCVAEPGDWIILEDNNFRVYDSDLFEETFEICKLFERNEQKMADSRRAEGARQEYKERKYHSEDRMRTCVGCANPEYCIRDAICNYTGSPMLNPDGSIAESFRYDEKT